MIRRLFTSLSSSSIPSSLRIVGSAHSLRVFPSSFIQPTTRRLFSTTTIHNNNDDDKDTKKAHPPTLDLSNPSGTVFAKILRGELPCKKVYEDEHALAFHDLNPIAPTHVLVIPKSPIASIARAEEKDKVALGNLMYAATKTAEVLGLQNDGYRLIINHGKHGQQTVGYLHIHIIGGRQLTWHF